MSGWSSCATRRSRSDRASVQDLCHEIFPRKHWGVMAESETFAHLEHMVCEGEAESWRDDSGRMIYRAEKAS